MWNFDIFFNVIISLVLSNVYNLLGLFLTDIGNFCINFTINICNYKIVLKLDTNTKYIVALLFKAILKKV